MFESFKNNRPQTVSVQQNDTRASAHAKFTTEHWNTRDSKSLYPRAAVRQYAAIFELVLAFDHLSPVKNS